MNIPLNIDWQQILLHLFNFAILVGGLYLLLYNPVKNSSRREKNTMYRWIRKLKAKGRKQRSWPNSTE